MCVSAGVVQTLTNSAKIPAQTGKIALFALHMFCSQLHYCTNAQKKQAIFRIFLFRNFPESH